MLVFRSMKSSKTIMALGFQTFEDYDQRRGCVIEYECDTIAEAKQKAKQMLTEEYRQSSEASERLMYSQVTVNGVCEYDYFGKPDKQGKTLVELAKENKL